ncbi:MAG TPA: hypothetical protein DGT58_01570 [Erysipelotrichaceae bacterium]|nr:hypothetical protein [Erysipelotrichaceae bacterium]
MKRILTMQDLSCAGRCSLTEALPVLSAMGLEAAVLPTAVLSSHTAFKNVYGTDLLDMDREILHSWKENGITFDAIYIGYLGSTAAVNVAQEVIVAFGNKIPILIDPAFGDHGRLYRGIDEDFPKLLCTILTKATIICPNLTEACFLTGTPYREDFSDPQYQQLLKKLASICDGTVILTGIDTGNGEIATLLSSGDGGYEKCAIAKEPASFHGTGDLWASAFIGACMRGMPAMDAMNLASRFVKEAIHITLLDHGEPLFGTEFERALSLLINALPRE